MGHRANFAIVRDREFDLYYSHWGAYKLPNNLFWGPAHAQTFVEKQRLVDRTVGWLDGVWAEGGAVIDQEKKTLLFFGGEYIEEDIELREVYLEMLRHSWKGWDIEWAYDGILDIASYVGVSQDAVLESIDIPSHCTLSSPEERDWLESICTVSQNGVTKAFPLADDPEEYLLYGPKLLVDASLQKLGCELLDINDWIDRLPSGGFHVDMESRTLDFWLACSSEGIFEAVQKRWPGWEVRWHRDRYDSQIQLAKGSLTYRPREREQIIEQLLNLLREEVKPFNLQGLTEFITDQVGENAWVNPKAVRDEILIVNHEMRERILAEVIAKIQ